MTPLLWALSSRYRGPRASRRFRLEPGVRTKASFPAEALRRRLRVGIGRGVGASQWRTYVRLGYGGIPPGQAETPNSWFRNPRAHREGREGRTARGLIDNRIVIEQVFFREAKAEILPASEPVLRAVIQV